MAGDTTDAEMTDGGTMITTVAGGDRVTEVWSNKQAVHIEVNLQQGERNTEVWNNKRGGKIEVYQHEGGR